ncbi:MAG TPA: hypothetical protein VL360_06410 [Gammaproteobacteria bacterium]|nr:hypothetical protein [Gammaproteobacteria bacterium]
MSIIYDALKKSQEARAAKIQIPRRPRKLKVVKRKNIIITMLILSTIFTIIAALTTPGSPGLKLPMFGKKNAKPPASAIAAAPRLMLEGVFLSDTEKLAMINHRSYHEGDSINGMQVVSIAFDQVKLGNKQRSIVLRSALTQLD